MSEEEVTLEALLKWLESEHLQKLATCLKAKKFTDEQIKEVLHALMFVEWGVEPGKVAKAVPLTRELEKQFYGRR